jgi:hypothetical protein
MRIFRGPERRERLQKVASDLARLERECADIGLERLAYLIATAWAQARQELEKRE